MQENKAIKMANKACPGFAKSMPVSGDFYWSDTTT